MTNTQGTNNSAYRTSILFWVRIQPNPPGFIVKGANQYANGPVKGRVL